MKTLVALLICLGLTACTEQARTKHLGGKTVLTLPEGEKLITATWKDNNLWLLFRTRRPTEEPENYFFQETSSWGLLEGRITIVEK